MTRCYEYYCLFVCTPEKCELSVRGMQYVNQYIEAMQREGVKFDKTPNDKDLFFEKQVELGTEKAYTQQQVAPSSPPPEPPDGEWNVIVVDPPWESHSGNYDPISHRGPPTYDTMSVDEIKAVKLPITEDAIIWLWTINYYLRDAYDVLETWGLTYRSILVWVKPHIGLGKWLRNRAEFCLVATKGNPNWYLVNQSNVLEAPRREHSRKPDEFYELVDELCAGKKLDMFAREPRDGWDVWGAEVDLFA